MLGRVGMPELIIILVIALLIFGAAKLPQIGKGLGRALKEFKKEARGSDDKPEEGRKPS